MLCDEQNALAAIREAHDLGQLKHAFFTSLGGNLRAFRYFCENEPTQGVSRFRIFKLKARLGDYLYAFCEKNTILGCQYTVVFLAKEQSGFHRLLSPSSDLFRDVPGKVIYEILQAQSRNYYDKTSLSPEAFLLLSRTPHLIETILTDRCGAKYCSIEKVTDLALAIISQKANLRSTDVSLIINVDSGYLVELPVELYVTLLYLSLAISATASSDHKLTVSVTSLGHSTEVEISTVTNRLNDSVEQCDLCALEDLISPVGSYSKIASIIAQAADMEASARYDKNSSVLSLTLGIGYEKLPAPDFKFSDPTEYITSVSKEAEELLKIIEPDISTRQ